LLNDELLLPVPAIIACRAPLFHFTHLAASESPQSFIKRDGSFQIAYRFYGRLQGDCRIIDLRLE
jgi:hypothetical protein